MEQSTTTKTSYDVSDALAVMLTSPPDTADGDLKAMLAEASDIPANRLDFAFDEIKQGLPALYPIVMVLAISLGRQPTAHELRPMLTECNWVDDDGHDLNIHMSVQDEDGHETASVSMHSKLN